MKTVAFDIDDLLVDTKARKEVYLSDLLLSDDKEEVKQRYNLGGYNHLDTPLPFAIAVVHFFEALGYKIIYVTGRRESAIEVSERVLSDMGFPISRDIMFFKPNEAILTPDHKRSVFEYLIENGADIQYFFDDKESNLTVAEECGIPNLYLNLRDFVVEAIDWEVFS